MNGDDDTPRPRSVTEILDELQAASKEQALNLDEMRKILAEITHQYRKAYLEEDLKVARVDYAHAERVTLHLEGRDKALAEIVTALSIGDTLAANTGMPISFNARARDVMRAALHEFIMHRRERL